jgi:hypothetical protein
MGKENPWASQECPKQPGTKSNQRRSPHPRDFARGRWAHATFDHKDYNEMTKIASPLKNAARSLATQAAPLPLVEKVREVQDIDNDTHFFELRFQTSSGLTKSTTVPRSYISSPREIQKTLLDKGGHLHLSENSGLAVIREALKAKPKFRPISETSYAGWHGASFTWRGGVHGPARASLRFRSDESFDGATRSHGRLEEWKAGLETPCERSDILVFSLATGFAAPFLRHVEINEGAMFYFWGKSTTGKTLAQRASMSIFQRAEETDLLTFDLTSRKLEEACAAHNDLAMILNEAERLEKNASDRAKSMQDIAYRLAGGVGRVRSAYATRNAALSNKKWRILCLGSGETTAKRPDRRSGEEVRLIDIPVPAPESGGIFSTLSEAEAADAGAVAYEMAQSVETTILENYGVAFAPFMDSVCDDLDAAKKRANAHLQKFTKILGRGQDARALRLVKKFGIVYAGAMEACRHGIAPWTETHAHRAISTLCRVALQGIGADDSTADKAALAEIRDAVRDSRRFPILRKGAGLPANLAQTAIGFRRAGPQGKLAHIDANALGQLIDDPRIRERLLCRLVDRGILLVDAEGKRTRKVQVAGFGGNSRVRYYCFRYDDLIRTGKAVGKGSSRRLGIS